MSSRGIPAELNTFASRVFQRRLRNGATVLVVPRPSSATAHFAVAFRAGGVDEPDGRAGIAHLYEHMAFKGTSRIGSRSWPKEKRALKRLDELDERMMHERARVPKPDEKKLARLKREFDSTEARAEGLVKQNELDEIYGRNGARGLNAYTSNDATVYIVNLPSNRVPLWAAMEAERIREPVMRQFYRERNVVIEELRLIADSPRWRLWDTMQTLAFKAHPYRVPVIGWKSDLERMTPRDLVEFFRSRYRPDRAVFVAVGDVDPARLVRMLDANLSFWKAGPPPRPVTTAEPEQRGERRAIEHCPASPQLAIAWPIPTHGHPDKVPLDALAWILGAGPSSRLHTVLVKRRRIAFSVDVSSGFPGERYPRLFAIGAVPKAPHAPAEVEEAITKEIGRLVRHGVTKRELEKAANQIEANVFQNLTDNSNLAPALAHAHAVTGDWRTILRILAEIRRVKTGDVVRVAREYLVPQRRNTVTVTAP
jgi:predicted Zn-dependent peptidase